MNLMPGLSECEGCESGGGKSAPAVLKITAGRSASTVPGPRRPSQKLRVLYALQDAGLFGLTTRDIIERCATCKPNNRVNDCRRDGFEIDMAETYRDGVRIVRYFYRGRRVEVTP